jgi:hypothetical protein
MDRTYGSFLSAFYSQRIKIHCYNIGRGSASGIKLSFFTLLTRSEGRVVQRSVDRVGKYARDINANALAQMH